MSEESERGSSGPKRAADPQIHIEVHIHLDGAALHGAYGAIGAGLGRATVYSDRASADGGGRASGPFWKRAVATAGIAGVAAWLVVQAGHRAGGGSPQPAVVSAPSQFVESPRAESAASSELVRELRQPPRVEAAPGAGSGAGASGPSAFGLQD